jgi:hypothetical protein
MHALMTEPSSSAALLLPPRLRQLVEGLGDRYLAERLARVWAAAREALEEVERLALAPSGLDEPGADPAHLSLWEHVAPAVRDTLMALQHLVTRVRTDFPAHPPEDYTASDGAPIVRAQPAEQAARALGLAAARLSTRAQALGERLRRPEAEGEPQELEAELREVHRSLRTELRELVLQSAAPFAPLGHEALPGPHAASPGPGVRHMRAVPEALSGADRD